MVGNKQPGKKSEAEATKSTANLHSIIGQFRFQAQSFAGLELGLFTDACTNFMTFNCGMLPPTQLFYFPMGLKWPFLTRFNCGFED
jgi:hypothetical protein